MMAQQHNGECFCGAVRITFSGEPESMAYCHSSGCAGSGFRRELIETFLFCSWRLVPTGDDL